jgi:high-affinity iron transporter
VPRRALIVLLCLAGCGGGSSQAPTIRDTVAPPPTREIEVPTVKGSDQSAQEMADAAALAPLSDGSVRPERKPLPEALFDAPIARYRAYSVRQATAMTGRVEALRRALAAGDRQAARREWSATWERYLLIGAAYGALGDLDAAITDERLELERGLWNGEPLSALRPVAKRLAGSVRELRRTVTKVEITPLDYAIRAHEILEDAQRDMLSGAAAPYSGAGVLATAASLRATDAVIGTLRTLLARRGALAPVEYGLLGLRRELAAIRRAHGGEWPALDELSRGERQRLNGRLGAGLELLARVPGALETQYPPAIPRLRR